MATPTYNYIELTGTIVPDTDTIQSDVIQEYQAAFGQDLITTPDTPQGVLITGEVTARDSVARNNAALANQINPNLAGGVYLDAICALTGLVRSEGTKTTVAVAYTGEPGTVISTGVEVQFSVSSVLFTPSQEVTLDSGGLGTGILVAEVNGPIVIDSGSTGVIVNAAGVLGLQTVTTTAGSIPGQSQQSDAALRQLRRQTLALQADSLSFAIISALNNLTTVQSVSYRENYTGGPLTIDGILIAAHSIFVCVYSFAGTSDDLDVATAIFYKKGGGCGYSVTVGTPVTVNVVDPASGQTFPVTYARPTEIPILVRVTVSAGTYTGDIVQATVNAILAYANGQIPSEPGFIIGETVSSFELAGAINQLVPGLFVREVQTAVSSITPVFSSDPIDITLYQVATVAEGAIQVTIV